MPTTLFDDQLEKLIERNAKLESRLDDVGIDPALAEPRENLFSKTLNAIDRPKQNVLGLLDSALIRGDLFDIGITGALGRAKEERANAFDILRRETNFGPVARALIGFPIEVATDPLSFIGVGSAAKAFKGGKAVTETGEALFNTTAQRLAIKAGKKGVSRDVAEVASNELADDLFRQLAGLQDDIIEEARLLKKAGHDGSLEEIAKQGLPGFEQNDILSLASRLKERRSKIGELATTLDLPEEELLKFTSGEGLDELFAEPSVRFSIAIPFLGHATKKKAGSKVARGSLVDEMEATFQNQVHESLKPEFGPVRQGARSVAKKTFETAGAILNPHIVELGEVPVPRSLLNAFKGSKEATKSFITSVNDTISEGLGVIGEGGKAHNIASGGAALAGGVVAGPIGAAIAGGATLLGGAEAARISKLSFDGLRKLAAGLGKHFSNTQTFGRAGGDITRDFLGDRAATETIALHEARNLFGKNQAGKWLIDDPASVEMFQEVGHFIDSTGGLAFGDMLGRVDEIKKNFPALRKEVDELMSAHDLARADSTYPMEDVVNRFKSLERNLRAEHPEKLAEIFGENVGSFEDLFLVKLQKAIDAGEISDEAADLTRTVISAFDDIRQRELRAGVDTGFIDAYIPHIYRNLDVHLANKTKAGKGATSAGGGINATPGFAKPRTQPNLIEAFTSSGLVGETNIAELYKRRYQAHLEAIAKKKYVQRMAIERGMPASTVKALYEAAKDSASNPGLAEALAREGFSAPSFQTYGEAVDGLAALGKGSSDKVKQALINDPAIRSLVEQHGDINKFFSDFDGTVKQIHENVIAQGLSNKHLDHIQSFGEWNASGIIKVPTIKNGKQVMEEVVLPKDIADAMNDMMNRVDLLRKHAKPGGALDHILQTSDTITNWAKRIFTVPWPAYWSQNVVGDSLLRFADGGLAAIEPGLMARTMSVLDGTGEIVTRTGQRIPAETFLKLLRESGTTFSHEEYLDVVKAFNNSDVERQARRAKGVIGNLKEGSGKAAIAEGLSTAQDFMRDNFENFFRVNHLVHHLEKGSSFRDAIRMANQAVIDYRDLTPFEQSVARRFYMFYGWISKSSKHTINQLFFNPGGLQAQLNSAEAIAEAFSAQDALPSYEEVDSRALASLVGTEQISFALGRGPEGNQITGRGFGLPLNTLGSQFNLQLPRNYSVGEVIDTFNDSLTRTAQKQFATANPIIKAAAEKATGRNLYFDQPLNAKFLRRLPQLEDAGRKIAGYSHDSVPASLFRSFDEGVQSLLDGVPDGKGNIIVDPGKMWLLTNFIPGFARAVSTTRSFSDSRLDAKHGLLRTLTGVRVEEGDPTRSYQYNRLDNLQDLLEDKSIKEREIQAGIRDENGKLIKKKDLIN